MRDGWLEIFPFVTARCHGERHASVTCGDAMHEYTEKWRSVMGEPVTPERCSPPPHLTSYTVTIIHAGVNHRHPKPKPSEVYCRYPALGTFTEHNLRLELEPSRWHNGSSFVFWKGGCLFDSKPVPTSAETHTWGSDQLPCWPSRGWQV